MAYADLDPSKNLYDLSKGRENYIYRIKNGEKTEERNTYFILTNAIPVQPGDVLMFYALTTGTSGTHLYHYSVEDVSSKDNVTVDKFIKQLESHSGYSYLEYTVPANTYYVGCAGITQTKNKVIINKKDAPAPSTITITGSITWNDSDNIHSSRPSQVTVNLLSNGVVSESKTVTSNDSWAYTFADKPYKDSSGNVIQYTITQNAISEYTTTVNGYNITNTYSPSKITITGNITWNDSDNVYDTRPSQVTVKLIANGIVNESKTITANDSWSYTFADKNRYDSSGSVIQYTISEDDIPIYAHTIDGYNIINTYTVADDINRITLKKVTHYIEDIKSRKDITAINGKVATIESNINNIDERVTNLEEASPESGLLTGKVINFLGDSITKGRMSSSTDIANPTFCQKIASNLGCTVNNYGVSATSICNGSSEAFVTRLNRMTETKLDALIIFGGVNDQGDNRATELGTINDAASQGTNFYASFKYLITQAIAKYPAAIIAVITPMRRNTESANVYGITLPDIVNAEIEVAKYYGVPLLDFYHHGGINPALSSQRSYTADGLHPLQSGIDLFLSPMFTEFVKSLLQYRPTVE